jgi:hypothetical protein
VGKSSSLTDEAGNDRLRRRAPLAGLRLLSLDATLVLCCFLLFASCARKDAGREGFQGSPLHGMKSYAGEMRQSAIEGDAFDTARVIVSGSRLRYDLRGDGPPERLVLLADLDSGRIRLLNPANRSYLEGSFAPQRWIYLEYLMESLPTVMRPTIVARTEETLGSEEVSGHSARKIRVAGREELLGEERAVTRTFWVSEQFCLPLRQEEGSMRREFTGITSAPVEDALFALPAGYRKAADFAELMK